jgi:hypothetical protein
LLKSKRALYLISFCLSIVLSFIPKVGIQVEEIHFARPYLHFGFPAEWLSYYGGIRFGVNILGILFNFFFIYLCLLLLIKTWKSVKKLSN